MRSRKVFLTISNSNIAGLLTRPLNANSRVPVERPTPSAANVAKINFNFMIATTIEALAESFSVVEKSGIDPKIFYEMVIGTAFGCPIFENYGRQLSQHGWNNVGFKLALGLKDVRLAQGTAAAVGARMRLGELLETRFSEAVAHGYADKDWTAIALDIRAEAGLAS